MRRSYKTFNSLSSFSRFVPILLVIIITIVAIAAVITIGRSIFGGGETKEQQASPVNTDKEALLSTAENRAVRLTVRGPIVSDEAFRSYQITIAPNSRNMTTYNGYLDKPIDSKQLANNVKAYEELVYALEKRKMIDGKQLTDEQNDLRGICATGKVYKFETLLSGQATKTLWTSDCSGSKGSANANVSEVVDMFIKQIPDGGKLATSVGLYQKDTLFKL